MQMETEKANKHIQCTVDSCRNHCEDASYCSLDTVSIGTHEPNPSECQCVDCESFMPKRKDD